MAMEPMPTSSRDRELRDDLLMRMQSVRELIETRLNASDKAVEILAENVNRVPTLLDRTDANIRELFKQKLDALAELTDERFEGLKIAFREDKIAASTAVSAAFAAQEKLSVAQNLSNTAAISKSEASTTKELESLDGKISALKEAMASDIRNLEGRLNRGEGSQVGERQAASDNHAGTMQMLGVIGGIVSVLALIAMIIFNVENGHPSAAAPTIVSPAVVPVGPK